MICLRGEFAVAHNYSTSVWIRPRCPQVFLFLVELVKTNKILPWTIPWWVIMVVATFLNQFLLCHMSFGWFFYLGSRKNSLVLKLFFPMLEKNSLQKLLGLSRPLEECELFQRLDFSTDLRSFPGRCKLILPSVARGRGIANLLFT